MMAIFLWILLIIVVLLILFFVILDFALRSFMRPNTIEESVGMMKDFLGFDFGDEYTILQHESQNNHPDRPLNVSLELSESSFSNLMTYLSSIESTSNHIINDDGKIKYNQYKESNTNHFSQGHSATHIGHSSNGYTFFTARLSVDYNTRIIRYRETGY